VHCPFCNHDDTKVTDSRLAGEGHQIRRRRECQSCGERFTTFETAELVMPQVVKNDSSRQPFDEGKLRSGIMKALEKRPVARESVEAAIGRIGHRLRVLGEREVASRTIGGDCARLLRFGAGQALEDLVISHAVGSAVPVMPQEGGAGVLMIPIPGAGILRRIEGIPAARAVPWIVDILIGIREGYELVPLPEGAAYLGFIFAHAPTPAAAEAALRESHAKLKIVVAPVMALEDRRQR